MDLVEATDWITECVRARVEVRTAKDPRRNRLAETERAWDRAQQAVEALMAAGGPAAVAPQTSLLVAPHVS